MIFCQVIKFIGASWQISLGKEHAGRHVLVEMPELGVWVIRTATVIPDNEKWMHTPAIKKDLTAALDWAQKTPARATDLSKLKWPKQMVRNVKSKPLVQFGCRG